jgi:hypothetical protein
MDVPALHADVTQAREAAATVETACVAATLAVETFVRETAVAWDSAALRVKDADDRSTLAEREALERVSRAEAENATV